MLFSRFWYLLVAVALGMLVGWLVLANAVFNRTSRESMEQALEADNRVVQWYLNDHARRRSSLLLKVCLDETIRKELHKASSKDEKVPQDVRDRTRSALKTLVDEMPDEYQFSSLLAIDQLGRVIGQVGFDQSKGIDDFDMGGFAIVADALHGWVRDDAWVLDDRIYLVVARPVEVDAAQMPAGAVVGLRIVDASFAKQLAKRTGATVGFFAGTNVGAKASPDGSNTTQLDSIVADIKNLADDPSYQSKGISAPRILMDDIRVIYAKIPGEAWDLGAGFVVGRAAKATKSPIGLLDIATDSDWGSIPWWFVVLLAIAAAGAGIAATVIEHTRPLRAFRQEAARLARGEAEILPAAACRGVYRKIAIDLNEGIEKVTAKGGVPRKSADLESVLGPIPAQPEMKAFAFADDEPRAPKPVIPPAPKDAAPKAPPNIPAPKPSLDDRPPTAVGMAASTDADTADRRAEDTASHAAAEKDIPAARPQSSTAKASGADEMAVWREVFEAFVRAKKQCGEPTAGLSFEKFQGTLRKNKKQLMTKTGCKQVKFSVYIKDSKAALKASPVR